MLELRNDLEKQLFALEVQGMDERYDAAVRMCRAWRGKNGYHSRLSECEVHPIRDAFCYAYALLNRDGEGDRARAHDLLYRVIPLQDINPARPTYGIWQYFLEEDLEEMNPPDWNWHGGISPTSAPPPSKMRLTSLAPPKLRSSPG